MLESTKLEPVFRRGVPTQQRNRSSPRPTPTADGPRLYRMVHSNFGELPIPRTRVNKGQGQGEGPQSLRTRPF
jgi:hypothetical protein